MKKTALHAALFALTLPMTLHAIGLGEMTIKSSIDQPFLAEIELLDVGSAPIVGIKVGVADPENFQQIGLERIAALSLLHFNIEKNAKGKLVIKVNSIERMTEPYMELVVDLIWPNGQLYKAYTVLLDPPGYQLVSTRAHSSPTYYKKVVAQSVTGHNNEPGVIDKTVITEVQNHRPNLGDGKKKTTYGPTITNENVWQIAQRYKTSETILPQVVLAIVGMNPDAFKDGNLNGLKVGIRLTIPSTQEILQVPADLATEEVMAHDNAWNDKSPINHVLSPPYMNAQVITPVPQANVLPVSTPEQATNSKIPAIPKFSIETITPVPGTSSKLIPTNSVVPVVNNNKPLPDQNNKQQNSQQDSNIKAEISITTAAVESVREANALLMEQLHLLQDHNKKLQQQLDKRDKEMALIQAQMKSILKERKAIAAQANAQSAHDNSSNLWPLLLLLIVAAGGGGFAYWYFKRRGQETNDEPYLSRTTPNEPKPDPFITPVQPDSIKGDEKAMLPVITAAIVTPDLSEHKETPAQSLEERVRASDESTNSFPEAKNSAEVVKAKSVKKHTSKKEHDDSHVVITPADVDIHEMNQETQSNSVPIQPKVKEEIPNEQLDNVKEVNVEFKSPIADIKNDAVQIQPGISEETNKEPTEQESEAPPIEFRSAAVSDIQQDSVHTQPDLNKETGKEKETEAPAIEFESAIVHEVKPAPFQIQPETNEDIDKEPVERENAPEVPAIEFESINVNDFKNDSTQAKTTSKDSDKNEEGEESPTLDLLEFESGLHHLLPEQSLKDKAKARQAEIEDDENNDEETEVIEKRVDYTSEQKTADDSPSEESHQQSDDTSLDLSLDLDLDLDTVMPEVVEQDTDQDLESDLDPEITEFFAEHDLESKPEPESEKKTKQEQITDEKNIIYRSPLQELRKLDTDDSLTANPLKSKAALNTLLALAKTYIGMDDLEAARSSLEEVLEFGSESQKAEAQLLLDEIKNK